MTCRHIGTEGDGRATSCNAGAVLDRSSAMHSREITYGNVCAPLFEKLLSRRTIRQATIYRNVSQLELNQKIVKGVYRRDNGGGDIRDNGHDGVQVHEHENLQK
jgi:hypothetical protein